MKDRHWRRLALALSIVAMLVSAWISLGVFEGLPHLEDEFANLWQAEVMAEGEISLESPAEPKSFLVPFVVDFQGQRFGKYPPGWPALLSLGARVGAASWVNPLLAGLAVWLTFRLAGRFLSAGLSFVAALLVAGSPMLLMLSGSLMSHNFSLVLALAFILSWLDLFGPANDRVVPAWLLASVAGGSMGLMVLTRPLTAVAVLLPFALHGIWLVISAHDRWSWLLLAAGLTLAFGSLLLVWQYALTGDPTRNLYTLWWEYDRVGFGPDIGTLEGGHNLRQAWINTRFSLRTGLHDLFGWPYLSWLFLPFGLWALRRRSSALPVLGVIPSLIGVYGLYWIGSWLLGPRYYYEALPPLALLTAAGVGWLGGWLGRGQAAGWRRLSITGALALLLAANLFLYSPIRLGSMQGLYGIDRSSLAPIAATDIEPALIIVHADHWSGYANLLPLRPPFSERDIQVAWSRSLGTNDRVAALFPDHSLYHYYTDQPGVLWRQPR